jgi:hypothetical protein
MTTIIEIGSLVVPIDCSKLPVQTEIEELRHDYGGVET